VRRPLPIHLASRGRIRLSLGDAAGARSDAEEAGRLAPGYSAAAELLAAIERAVPPAREGTPPLPGAP